MTFDEFPVTMMVLVTTFDGVVQKYNIFGAIPVANPKVPFSNKTSFKSLRYDGCTRGTPGGFFKNNIMITMRMNGVPLEFHASPMKFHLTGVESFEHGRRAMEELFNQLKDVRRKLENITPDLASKIWNYFSEKLVKNNRVWKITKPATYFAEPCQQGSVLGELLDYFFSFLHEYKNKEFFMRQLEWLLGKPTLFEGTLTIKQICPALVNYNYTLDFPISPFHLHERLEHIHSDFYSDYWNMYTGDIKLNLPYDPGQENIKRKKKVQCHTFKIYKSGKIIQHGPGGELAKQAYVKMLKLLKNVYPDLISPDL